MYTDDDRCEGRGNSLVSLSQTVLRRNLSTAGGTVSPLLNRFCGIPDG